MNRGPIRGQTQCRPDGQTRMLFRACSLGMGQKQLPAIDVKPHRGAAQRRFPRRAWETRVFGLDLKSGS